MGGCGEESTRESRMAKGSIMGWLLSASGGSGVEAGRSGIRGGSWIPRVTSDDMQHYLFVPRQGKVRNSAWSVCWLAGIAGKTGDGV